MHDKRIQFSISRSMLFSCHVLCRECNAHLNSVVLFVILCTEVLYLCPYRNANYFCSLLSAYLGPSLTPIITGAHREITE